MVGPAKEGSARNSADLRAAEEMAPKLASPLDICPATAVVDRAFNGR
jgi:hypothetical protein